MRERPPSFVARSYAMRHLLAQLEAWPRTRHRVAVVHGEAGTGRSRVARRLHHRWHPDAKIVTVDCHLGAAHVGKYLEDPPPVRTKRPGTLVLDGVEALESSVVRSLWKLKHNFSVGETDGWTLVCIVTESLDCVAAALHELPPSGRVRVPTLRQRRLDMPRLVLGLIDDISFDFDHAGASSVTSEALDALSSYEWPGNITQLQGALEHALVAVGDRSQVELRDLPAEIRGPALASGATGIASLADVERQHILQTLRALGGNRGETAAALGIHVNTLCNKLAKYGVGRRRRKRGTPAPDAARA